jgi:hypothetical protein
MLLKVLHEQRGRGSGGGKEVEESKEETSTLAMISVL